MDLVAPSSEHAASWLERVYLSHPDKVEALGWRVPTGELYRDYEKHTRAVTRFEVIPMPDIWGIIQIIWPWVTIVGPKGNRAYTAMRKR